MTGISDAIGDESMCGPGKRESQHPDELMMSGWDRRSISPLDTMHPDDGQIIVVVKE